LFTSALRHNLLLGAVGGSITLLLALFFASLLHRKIRGAALFRIAFFFPNIIASVAVAILWMLLYSTTDFGMVNALLGAIQRGLAAIGIEWLQGAFPFPFTDSKYLIYSLIPMMVWTATGFYMVLFVAAMENIPEEFYEAAKLDGATPVRQFWHVTLPFIREVLVVGVVFLLISSVKFFDAVWVLESQYPTTDSHVMATVLYQKVFSEYNIGYGAAVAVMLFALVFTATFFTLRFSRKEAVEY
jgi:ABC-type sugar transport system permease subunit